MDQFHYIVVGGGTAGSVIASRLSENPAVRVLLLEAGPASGPAEMAVPAAWPALLGSHLDWSSTTVPQRELNGALLPWPRGKVLGGSSALNAMGHIRGLRRDYDRWRKSGATGWSYEELLPYFKRSEDAEDDGGRDPLYRGFGGPMRVGPVPPVNALSEDFIEAASECGWAGTEDINGADQEGAFWYDTNIVEGVRQSASDAYLRPVLRRPNLVVTTNAFVRRLLMSDRKARTVEYVIGRQLHLVRATEEIVLTAGTIGSAQLLLLSGVGPSRHLLGMGIAPVVDLPGVGENLHDHPQCGIVYRSESSVSGEYNHGEVGARIRSRPSLGAPDIQLHLADVPLGPVPAVLPRNGFTISAALLAPASRGTLRLSSADPGAAPLLDPRYYEAGQDLEAMISGLRLARAVGEAGPLAKWRNAEALPGPGVQDAAGWRDFVRAHTTTFFHPVGTCRMGTDRLAVVDARLRVHGIGSLRVADASIMPSIVSAGTNATVLAIAERAAALIAEDHP